MAFGTDGRVKPDAAGTLLRTFIGSSCCKTPRGALVDTARLYQQATPEGDTESTLGEVFSTFPSLCARASLATKASPSVAPHYSLSKQSVIEQCNVSLEKMDVDSVDIFYLHSPDIKTDLDDTLGGVDQLHKEGKIVEFGLSSFPAWAVVDIWHRCKNRGMVLPTVYQGMYNVITRDIERELVPVAREFGLRLYVYSPLAGGLLAGRREEAGGPKAVDGGRSSGELGRRDTAEGQPGAGAGPRRAMPASEPVLRALEGLRAAATPPSAEPAASREVEDTTSVVGGVKVRLVVTETAARPRGPDMAGVALRWLMHHSCLAAGDGIVLEVSRNEHLVGNLTAWQGGPLPAELVEACDAAWEASRPTCEPYFTGYGAAPGGVEHFLSMKAPARQEGEAPGAGAGATGGGGS